jgi:hypothetical protein
VSHAVVNGFDAPCERRTQRTGGRLIYGPLNHLPSSEFDVNVAWPQLAGTAQTLTRAVGAMASARHAVARSATIRAELVQVAGRPARIGR